MCLRKVKDCSGNIQDWPERNSTLQQKGWVSRVFKDSWQNVTDNDISMTFVFYFKKVILWECFCWWAEDTKLPWNCHSWWHFMTLKGPCNLAKESGFFFILCNWLFCDGQKKDEVASVRENALKKSERRTISFMALTH